MNTSATESSVDIAAWFISRAQKDEWFLENEKLQNLLFLAQFHFSQQYKDQILMPSLFTVNKDGFREPNIERLLQNGRNTLSASRLSNEVDSFLEKIWKVYGAMSLKQLRDMIKRQTSYPEQYPSETKNIVEINSLVEKLKSPGKIEQTTKRKETEKKVLISQNGPVVVSKWQPRRLKNGGN